MDLHDAYMYMGWVVGGVIRLSFQSNSNSQKLSLWCKKKSLPTQMDLYDPDMVSYRIPYGYYNFLRGTNKIQCFDEISTSGKKLSI